MLGAQLEPLAYIHRVCQELGRVNLDDARRLADLLHQAYQAERFIFLFGNGGSACTASHFAEDLGKNCLTEAALRGSDAKRLKVLSLTDNVGWLTALGNDLGYDQIFVQQLAHYASPGDLAIAISGSGNSPNVLRAVEWANAHGLTTFGLTGFSGGKLREIQQAGIHVALDDMAMVETIHMAIGHWLVDDLYARVNGVGRYAQA